MMKFYSILFLSIIFKSSICCQEFHPDRIISKDTTISAGIDSITSNLIINENVTLTILPGAILYFKKDTCSGCASKIIVKGNLITNGTAENPIIYTSNDSLAGSGFMGVSIEKPIQSDDTIFFNHCIFEHSLFSGFSNGVISVNEFSVAKITNCTIRNNSNIGIYNKGNISLFNTSIYGGYFTGVYNSGTANIIGTSIYNNYRGGIYNKGNLLVINSTIFHNQAASGTNGPDGLPGRCDCYSSINGTNGLPGGNGENGGGIYNDDKAIAEIINSTISWNYAGNYGKGGRGGQGLPGICTKIDPITGKISISSCYFAFGLNGTNGKYGKGGGIYNSGILKLKNSIVAHNKIPDYSNDDIYGTINTSYYNIFSDNSNIGFTNDSVGNKFVDPLINVLQFNGGNTPTCALQSGSPAINALPQDLPGIPALDQRGFDRFDNPDIGSYEFSGCIPVEMTAKINSSKFGQDSWVFDISVVNDSIVWVKDGDADSISITTNGGASWIAKPLPIPLGFIRAAGGIFALSELKAYYILSISDLKGVYLTLDGGENWTKQTTGFNLNSFFPDIIHFWNENDGVAIGDASPNFEIYTTSNGGAQWNRVQDANMPDGNNEGTWNSQETYKIVGNSIFFLTNSGRIFNSHDKGKTWNVINTPFRNAADSTITFDFKDFNNGLISYCSNDGNNYKIYKTNNGGQTWENISTNNFYQRMKYIPSANAYFSMNTNGGLSYSCDDGLTWTSASNFNSLKLRCVSYSSTGKIFWGGFGTIYYSSPVLSVSAKYFTIAAPTDSKITFEILSNTNWTIISNQNWLSSGNSSGFGNSTITLTATENPTTETRTAVVTISGGGVSDQTIIVTQDPGNTGINDIIKNNVAIFPNPVSNGITIDNLSKNATVAIYDLNGILILTITAKSNNEKIDLSGLEKGVYLLRVTHEKLIATIKIIKL